MEDEKGETWRVRRERREDEKGEGEEFVSHTCFSSPHVFSFLLFASASLSILHQTHIYMNEIY